MIDNLFGQHIAQNQIIPALQAHYENKKKSNKPLVMSFHGTPGTGKNLVSDFIASAMYSKGSNSAYVHKFLGRTDFPLASKVNVYRVREFLLLVRFYFYLFSLIILRSMYVIALKRQ